MQMAENKNKNNMKTKQTIKKSGKKGGMVMTLIAGVLSVILALCLHMNSVAMEITKGKSAKVWVKEGEIAIKTSVIIVLVDVPPESHLPTLTSH